MTIAEITTYLIGIVTLLGVIIALWKRIEELWNNVVKPLWNKTKIPLFKFLVRPATLISPNGLIIGLSLFWVASYYREADSLDYMISNERVFLQLVALQAVAVSLYSFLWSTFIDPRMRNLISRWRSEARKKTKSNERNRNKIDDDTNENLVQPSDLKLSQVTQASRRGEI